MSDNDPHLDKSKQWRKRWRRRQRRQAHRQNNHVIGSHHHGREPYFCGTDGADGTRDCLTSIKIECHPGVSSDPPSEDSSSQPPVIVPQLHQTGESSIVVHYTVPSSENRTSFAQRKRKNKNNQQATTQSSKQHCNGAFTFGHKIDFHPRFSFHHSEGSSSKSTAVGPPQASPSFKALLECKPSTSADTIQPVCKPDTSTQRPPSSTAGVGPSNGLSKDTDSKRQMSSALVVPSKQCNVQRPVPTGIPTKYMAIDCEMVGTGLKGHISQLARCSIVSYDGDVVYDKFIKPPDPITDYRTRWSGIRPYNLYKATPYAEARKEILMLVRGKVLIGHAIHNDLKVLNYGHPKDLTRDTSRIPLLNIKAGFDEKQTVSLKRFTKALLNRDIQTGKRGHSSIEDAKATMELYKLIEVEWEQTLVSTAKNHGR